MSLRFSSRIIRVMKEYVIPCFPHQEQGPPQPSQLPPSRCNFKQRNFKKYHHLGTGKSPLLLARFPKVVPIFLALAGTHRFPFYLYRRSSGYTSVQVSQVSGLTGFGKIQLLKKEGKESSSSHILPLCREQLWTSFSLFIKKKKANIAFQA